MAESYNHDAEPILCVNNCGFFGSKTTMNLCSKCYRDTVLNATAVQAAFEKTQKLNVQIAPQEKSDLPSPSNPAISPSPVMDVPASKAPNRCFMCNKRVGLNGFKCRCGDLFCSTHRYSDSHNCSFDYKAAGRDAIAKANPIVKASKIDKI